MSLSAPIYQLKRKAKLLSREAGIPLNQALDRIAKGEGYEAWSLLMKRNPEKSPEITQQQKDRLLSSQITSLPLSKEDRAIFIEAANEVFETVMYRMEPENPELTRKLWDAGDYVDNMLTDDMLPISGDYALSLIDAFLVHHVLGLAVQADQEA